MYKNISSGLKKINVGKKIQDATAAVGQAGAAVGKSYVAASSLVYDVGRFNPYLPFSHTSTQPRVYDELHVPFVRDIPPLERVGLDPTNMTVSIPFEMRGQKIFALKTSKVDSCGRSKYPRLLVTFRDLHPEFLGDETILIQPGGKAGESIKMDDANLTWMVWQPRNVKIATRRREVTKAQAEIDAMDIARELSKNVKDSSSGSIIVNPNVLLNGINIFTKYSEPLRARWKILEDRYAFMRHITMRPHAVAAVLRSIVEMPPKELIQLIDEMQAGDIQSWAGFLDAINKMPNVNAIAGGAAIAEQHGMRTSLYKDDRAIAESIPPSIFVSALGLPYFLAYLDAREKSVEPNIRALAEDNAKVVSAMIQFHRRFAQVRLEAIEAGTQQLDARKNKPIAAAEQAVRDLLDLQEQQFRGNLIVDSTPVEKTEAAPQAVPQALPPGKETKQGGAEK
jgi:hypothetical protein